MSTRQAVVSRNLLSFHSTLDPAEQQAMWVLNAAVASMAEQIGGALYGPLDTSAYGLGRWQQSLQQASASVANDVYAYDVPQAAGALLITHGSDINAPLAQIIAQVCAAECIDNHAHLSAELSDAEAVSAQMRAALQTWQNNWSASRFSAFGMGPTWGENTQQRDDDRWDTGPRHPAPTFSRYRRVTTCMTFFSFGGRLAWPDIFMQSMLGADFLYWRTVNFCMAARDQEWYGLIDDLHRRLDAQFTDTVVSAPFGPP